MERSCYGKKQNFLVKIVGPSSVQQAGGPDQLPTDGQQEKAGSGQYVGR